MKEHEVFVEDVGTWDAELEIRPAPGADPQRSKGTSVARLRSGGKWLVIDFKNDTTGFEGHGVYGWDVVKQTYVGTWVDDMRPFIAVSTGTWDPATRTMTHWTEAPGPGGKPIRWRETTEKVSADRQIYRVFMPTPDGGEFEMMTAVYTRRR
jgi:hypothetical protein